ncbi:MAG: hypothetical protein U0457_05675 [Candidatus Sericytochromatia bacterium]
MSNAVEVFTNKLKDWQREGFYVLLNNFYNMREKNMGFVVSTNEAEQKFVFKFYLNKVLDEKHYSYDEVNDLINRIDGIIRS